MATLIVDVPNTRARTRGGVPRPPPRPRIQLPTPALDAAPVIDTTGPVSNFVRTLYALAEGDYDDTQMEWIDGGASPASERHHARISQNACGRPAWPRRT